MVDLVLPKGYHAVEPKRIMKKESQKSACARLEGYRIAIAMAVWTCVVLLLLLRLLGEPDDRKEELGCMCVGPRLDLA